MKLILIRHGESVGNVQRVIYGKTDYDLTQKGLDQSEAMRALMKQEMINAIFASPLKRTQHLAQLIARDHGLEVKTSESISEMNYGVFEGLTPKEVERDFGPLYAKYLKDYETYVIPNGEGYFQFRERIYEFLKGLISQKGTYIAVTHSGVIRECLIYLLELKPEQVWHFKIEPGSCIQISYEKGYGILEQMRL
ncbi:MAG: histidine phosphatase family protein [Vallitaleaceae bacterium]|nr:histidine phosphatase family protein [Vallitaleaceae bacterium]